jgi:hypothetical protein
MIKFLVRTAFWLGAAFITVLAILLSMMIVVYVIIQPILDFIIEKLCGSIIW